MVPGEAKTPQDTHRAPWLGGVPVSTSKLWGVRGEMPKSERVMTWTNRKIFVGDKVDLIKWERNVGGLEMG